MTWTDERIDQLKTLWTHGLSATQIAARLGGVTRNAVIGKIHRLGLAGRATPRVSRPRPRPRRVRNAAVTVAVTQVAAPAPAPEPEPIREVELPPGERHTILTLTERTCKWPIGDPAAEDFHFCGRAKRPDDGPYCRQHARIAYVPIQRRTGKPFIAEPRGKKTFKERGAPEPVA